jgi:hypothetical protein
MEDPSQQTSGTQPAYGQQQQLASYPTNQAANFEAVFGSYHDGLRRAFETIRDGNLAGSGQMVIGVSEWLVSNAEMLGKAHTTRLEVFK